MKEIIVDVADMRLSSAADEILVAPSLGSCVALSIYDPGMLAGGLLIFMLPKMEDVNFPNADQFLYMFGDTGIPAFLRATVDYGMDHSRFKITLAGGGQISGQNEAFDIGHRNCNIAKELITEAGLSLEHESIGGIYNRTLSLHIQSGKVLVSNAGQEVFAQ